jgi:transposase
MHYELSDDEWATIRPMLPNKARGVPRGAPRFRATPDRPLMARTTRCPTYLTISPPELQQARL